MAESKKARKPRVNVAPKDETPEQAFVRLADSRTSKCIIALANLGKLGRRKGWNMAQKGEIIQALDNAISAVGDEFIVRKAGTPESKGPVFSLKAR